ncbi:MAG: double zinc ribbon domain-containing protein [Clostridia bacterium]|nr:double zinc ribbon domain-containing protein [Clostridia bacterium]
MRKVFREMSEAVFPSNIYCCLCGALIDRSRPYALCDSCIRKMHWITGRTCRKCGKALPDTFTGEICYDCMELEHSFTRGWSCLTYGMYERQLMMGIKYSGKGYVAVKMGDVLFDRMAALIEDAKAGNIIPFDLVLPVPVSSERLRKRGYNQSELMAGQFVRRWTDFAGKEFAPRLEKGILARQRETEMLRSLNPAERRLALRGAFGVKSGTEHRIAGRNALLIDDIYTTGATADACSRALLEAGCTDVYLLALCSGGNRKPDDTE